MTDSREVLVDLTAVILAVTQEVPRVLVTRRRQPSPVGGRFAGSGESLPAGRFDPARHRTLEVGMRQWVEEPTGLRLRFVEQLYTFANQFRDPDERLGGPRRLSVAYLGLSLEAALVADSGAQWRDYYDFLPWEDWREGEPRLVSEAIRPALRAWIDEAAGPAEREGRAQRVELCFGLIAGAPRGELALERYELLYEAGLVTEAARDQPRPSTPAVPTAGLAMAIDHRRILAAALGRLRVELAYRPVVFDLLPAEFTLFRLQQVVEALAGVRLHKQNFRRMVVGDSLVEATGRMETTGRGRPAALYRFHRDVILMRPAVGIGLPHPRMPSPA